VSVATGLFAGSAVFFVGDALIDRLGGEHRKDAGGKQAAGSALAIVLGIVLDGIPESVVIGLGLLRDPRPVQPLSSPSSCRTCPRRLRPRPG
jgi:ZIP family zinc transporter